MCCCFVFLRLHLKPLLHTHFFVHVSIPEISFAAGRTKMEVAESELRCQFTLSGCCWRGGMMCGIPLLRTQLLDHVPNFLWVMCHRQCFEFPSVRRRYWLGNCKSISPVKNLLTLSTKILFPGDRDCPGLISEKKSG